MWNDGCHGRFAAWTWIFNFADDCIAGWCMWIKIVVDIYILQDGAVSFAFVALYDISGELDNHYTCTCGVLCGCEKEA